MKKLIILVLNIVTAKRNIIARSTHFRNFGCAFYFPSFKFILLIYSYIYMTCSSERIDQSHSQSTLKSLFVKIVNEFYQKEWTSQMWLFFCIHIQILFLIFILHFHPEGWDVSGIPRLNKKKMKCTVHSRWIDKLFELIWLSHNYSERGHKINNLYVIFGIVDVWFFTVND